MRSGLSTTVSLSLVALLGACGLTEEGSTREEPLLTRTPVQPRAGPAACLNLFASSLSDEVDELDEPLESFRCARDTYDIYTDRFGRAAVFRRGDLAPVTVLLSQAYTTEEWAAERWERKGVTFNGAKATSDTAVPPDLVTAMTWYFHWQEYQQPGREKWYALPPWVDVVCDLDADVVQVRNDSDQPVPWFMVSLSPSHDAPAVSSKVSQKGPGSPYCRMVQPAPYRIARQEPH